MVNSDSSACHELSVYACAILGPVGVLSCGRCHSNNRQIVTYLGVSSDRKYVSLPFFLLLFLKGKRAPAGGHEAASCLLRVKVAFGATTTTTEKTDVLMQICSNQIRNSIRTNRRIGNISEEF